MLDKQPRFINYGKYSYKKKRIYKNITNRNNYLTNIQLNNHYAMHKPNKSR